MQILSVTIAALALLAIAGALYVRLAPSDPGVWHIDPREGASGPGSALAGQDGALTYAESAQALLERVDAIAMATARTKRLAGSPSEGRITYVTRSALFGFPDYTTVAAQPLSDDRAELVIFARLRFGQSDLGVNRARVAKWVSRLGTPLRLAEHLDPEAHSRKDVA